MPLMLFSGTFFPLSQLPGWLRAVAYVTPLWHGVALCRAFSLGTAAGDPAGDARPRRLPGRAGRRRHLGRGPHLPQAPVCLKPSPSRMLPPAGPARPPEARRHRHRQPAADRAARPRLPARLAACSSPGSSSRCSTCCRWASGWACWSGRCPVPAGSRSRTGEFVAPGLLAVSSMNGAMYDSTFNVFFRLKYAKLYDAVLATPMRPDPGRAGRDRLGPGPRHHLRRRVHAGHAGAGPGALAVGRAGRPGGGADRLRLRRHRHVRHHLHEELAGLRLRDPGQHAAVPVLRHVLPAQRLPARRSRS